MQNEGNLFLDLPPEIISFIAAAGLDSEMKNFKNLAGTCKKIYHHLHSSPLFWNAVGNFFGRTAYEKEGLESIKGKIASQFALWQQKPGARKGQALIVSYFNRTHSSSFASLHHVTIDISKIYLNLTSLKCFHTTSDLLHLNEIPPQYWLNSQLLNMLTDADQPAEGKIETPQGDIGIYKIEKEAGSLKIHFLFPFKQNGKTAISDPEKDSFMAYQENGKWMLPRPNKPKEYGILA
jgi:hypothetical protein